MRDLRAHRDRRGGFTLVELLMVIAIIGVLAALLSAAVAQALRKGRQSTNQQDINQLAVALESFKTQFSVYPPSRVLLYKNLSSYGSSQLDVDSKFYIGTMFPRINWVNVDWTGGVGGSGDPGWTLEGQQCLVFFLGGIPDNTSGVAGCLGFSTSQTSPQTSGGTRIGPFFDFLSNRLVGSGGFYSYNDAYGHPYAYFSSYRQANGYNRYYSSYANSDCTSLGVWPYAEASGRYLKSSTYQIISAGRDQTFGRGTDPASPSYWRANTTDFTWAFPAGAAAIGTSNGMDDQSNFSGSLLGALPTQ